MKKIRKGLLFALVCAVMMGIFGCDSTKEEKDEAETAKSENNQSGYEQGGSIEAPKSIKAGYYYNADDTAEIIVYEDGIASYLPNMEEDDLHRGEYTYEDGIFTINVGTAYWKFANENNTFVLIGYKYAGKVHNVMDESQVFSYSEVRRPGIRPITYVSEAGGELYIVDDWASYDIDNSINTSSNRGIAGSYTLENGILTISDGEAYAKFGVYDDYYVLRERWYNGSFAQFAEGEEVFCSIYGIYSSFEQEPKQWTNREKVGAISEDASLVPECGYYYCDDMKSEIVIYDTGYARFCPDTYGEKDYYGEYSIEDGMFVIRETELMFEQIFDEENAEYKVVTHEQVVSVNKFEIGDNQLVHKEYIDYQDKINTIDNGVCCTFSDKRITDRIRPGTYVDKNDECINTDGKGSISKYMYLAEDVVFFIGTYEMDGNTISAITENGDTMTLVLERGKLIITGYSIGEHKLEEGVELPAFEYCY